MAGSKLDFQQIIKLAYDEASGGLKTTPSSATVFAIELDANDGDSVLSVHSSQVVVQASGEVSCVGMKSVCLYGTGTVSVSPEDSAGTFYDLSLTELVPANICARRIKIVGTGKIVVQSV